MEKILGKIFGVVKFLPMSTTAKKPRWVKIHPVATLGRKGRRQRRNFQKGKIPPATLTTTILLMMRKAVPLLRSTVIPPVT